LIRKGLVILGCFIIFLWYSKAHALELELTQGINAALPVAVVPFEGQLDADADDNNIAQVIQTDLQNSGHFQGFFR